MRYDSSVGQYRGDNGRFVDRDTVLALIDDEAIALGLKLQTHVKAAIGGKLTAIDLAEKMSQDLKLYSIQMAAMARGGINKLTRADYGKIGQAQSERNRRLKGFVDVLINGEITEKQALARAKLYAGSIKQVHSAIEHEEMGKYYRLAKRLLNPLAAHCPQCISHERLLWTRLEDIVPTGTRCNCRQNCKCIILYKN
jgi:hypothetical protein